MKLNANKQGVASLFDNEDYPEDYFSLERAFSGRSIILYGAGESSIWFFEIVTDIFGYSASLVLDKRFVTGDRHEGVSASSPDIYKPTEDEQRDAVVVICSGNEIIQTEMLSSAQELGFQNVLFLRDIYEIHNPFSQPEELKNKGFYFYQEQKENILAASELFADELSENVFKTFLQTHMQRKPVQLPTSPREEQYFPKDISLSQGYSHFISCGAYDGDTLRLLNKKHGKVDEIICFEAEPEIFQRLAGYIKGNKESLADVILALPCAVYSDEKIRNFTSATGLGSRISETGDLQIQCVSLDHILPNFKPTFISMDIEGAEPHALKGAEEMIRQNCPDLAICLYHAPNHLWEIPLYLESLGLGYHFYLRNYTSFTIETVLYATVI